MRAAGLPLALSVVGLVALAVSPLAAVVFAGVLLVGGVVVASRGDRVTGFGIGATGVALFLAAVLVLALVQDRQDKPVILGPDSGLTSGG